MPGEMLARSSAGVVSHFQETIHGGGGDVGSIFGMSREPLFGSEFGDGVRQCIQLADVK